VSRRLLPEAAYDFWVCDGRDGETTPRRDTIAEARKDRARFIRAQVVPAYMRCCFTVEWCVNERKVLCLLSGTT